jgi:hypothetical protein
MSIVAPHVRKHLSADALFRLVYSSFASLSEHRLDDTEISLSDALMSAFAMFSPGQAHLDYPVKTWTR